MPSSGSTFETRLFLQSFFAYLFFMFCCLLLLLHTHQLSGLAVQTLLRYLVLPPNTICRIGGILVSPLSARIFFQGFFYQDENVTLHIVDGYVTFAFFSAWLSNPKWSTLRECMLTNRLEGTNCRVFVRTQHVKGVIVKVEREKKKVHVRLDPEPLRGVQPVTAAAEMTAAPLEATEIRDTGGAQAASLTAAPPERPREGQSRHHGGSDSRSSSGGGSSSADSSGYQPQSPYERPDGRRTDDERWRMPGLRPSWPWWRRLLHSLGRRVKGGDDGALDCDLDAVAAGGATNEGGHSVLLQARRTTLPPSSSPLATASRVGLNEPSHLRRSHGYGMCGQQDTLPPRTTPIDVDPAVKVFDMSDVVVPVNSGKLRIHLNGLGLCMYNATGNYRRLAEAAKTDAQERRNPFPIRKYLRVMRRLRGNSGDDGSDDDTSEAARLGSATSAASPAATALASGDSDLPHVPDGEKSQRPMHRARSKLGSPGSEKKSGGDPQEKLSKSVKVALHERERQQTQRSYMQSMFDFIHCVEVELYASHIEIGGAGSKHPYFLYAGFQRAEGRCYLTESGISPLDLYRTVTEFSLEKVDVRMSHTSNVAATKNVDTAQTLSQKMQVLLRGDPEAAKRSEAATSSAAAADMALGSPTSIGSSTANGASTAVAGTTAGATAEFAAPGAAAPAAAGAGALPAAAAAVAPGATGGPSGAAKTAEDEDGDSETPDLIREYGILLDGKQHASIDIVFYRDTPGVYAGERLARDTLLPRTGVEVFISARSLCYGPWIDFTRQELQRHLIPLTYEPIPTQVGVVGMPRPMAGFEVWVEFVTDIDIVVPFKRKCPAPSPPFGIVDSKRDGRLVISLGGGSQYIQKAQYRLEGEENQVFEGFLLGKQVLVEANEVRGVMCPLLRASTVELFIDRLDDPIWNRRRLWNLLPKLRDAEVWWYMEYIGFFQDLLIDWQFVPNMYHGQRLSSATFNTVQRFVHEFVPCVRRIEVFADGGLTLHVNTNTANVLYGSDPCSAEDNCFVTGYMQSGTFAMVLPSDAYFLSDETAVDRPFDVALKNIQLFLRLPPSHPLSALVDPATPFAHGSSITFRGCQTVHVPNQTVEQPKVPTNRHGGLSPYTNYLTLDVDIVGVAGTLMGVHLRSLIHTFQNTFGDTPRVVEPDEMFWQMSSMPPKLRGKNLRKEFNDFLQEDQPMSNDIEINITVRVTDISLTAKTSHPLSEHRGLNLSCGRLTFAFVKMITVSDMSITLTPLKGRFVDHRGEFDERYFVALGETQVSIVKYHGCKPTRAAFYNVVDVAIGDLSLHGNVQLVATFAGIVKNFISQLGMEDPNMLQALKKSRHQAEYSLEQINQQERRLAGGLGGAAASLATAAGGTGDVKALGASVMTSLRRGRIVSTSLRREKKENGYTTAKSGNLDRGEPAEVRTGRSRRDLPRRDRASHLAAGKHRRAGEAVPKRSSTTPGPRGRRGSDLHAEDGQDDDGVYEDLDVNVDDGERGSRRASRANRRRTMETMAEPPRFQSSHIATPGDMRNAPSRSGPLPPRQAQGRHHRRSYDVDVRSRQRRPVPLSRRHHSDPIPTSDMLASSTASMPPGETGETDGLPPTYYRTHSAAPLRRRGAAKTIPMHNYRGARLSDDDSAAESLSESYSASATDDFDDATFSTDSDDGDSELEAFTVFEEMPRLKMCDEIPSTIAKAFVRYMTDIQKTKDEAADLGIHSTFVSLSKVNGAVMVGDSGYVSLVLPFGVSLASSTLNDTNSNKRLSVVARSATVRGFLSKDSKAIYRQSPNLQASVPDSIDGDYLEVLHFQTTICLRQYTAYPFEGGLEAHSRQQSRYVYESDFQHWTRFSHAMPGTGGPQTPADARGGTSLAMGATRFPTSSNTSGTFTPPSHAAQQSRPPSPSPATIAAGSATAEAAAASRASSLSGSSPVRGRSSSLSSPSEGGAAGSFSKLPRTMTAAFPAKSGASDADLFSSLGASGLVPVAKELSARWPTNPSGNTALEKFLMHVKQRDGQQPSAYLTTYGTASVCSEAIAPEQDFGSSSLIQSPPESCASSANLASEANAEMPAALSLTTSQFFHTCVSAGSSTTMEEAEEYDSSNSSYNWSFGQDGPNVFVHNSGFRALEKGATEGDGTVEPQVAPSDDAGSAAAPAEAVRALVFARFLRSYHLVDETKGPNTVLRYTPFGGQSKSGFNVATLYPPAPTAAQQTARQPSSRMTPEDTFVEVFKATRADAPGGEKSSPRSRTRNKLGRRGGAAARPPNFHTHIHFHGHIPSVELIPSRFPTLAPDFFVWHRNARGQSEENVAMESWALRPADNRTRSQQGSTSKHLHVELTEPVTMMVTLEFAELLVAAERIYYELNNQEPGVMPPGSLSDAPSVAGGATASTGNPGPSVKWAGGLPGTEAVPAEKIPDSKTGRKSSRRHYPVKSSKSHSRYIQKHWSTEDFIVSVVIPRVEMQLITSLPLAADRVLSQHPTEGVYVGTFGLRGMQFVLQRTSPPERVAAAPLFASKLVASMKVSSLSLVSQVLYEPIPRSGNIAVTVPDIPHDSTKAVLGVLYATSICGRGKRDSARGYEGGACTVSVDTIAAHITGDFVPFVAGIRLIALQVLDERHAQITALKATQWHSNAMRVQPGEPEAPRETMEWMNGSSSYRFANGLSQTSGVYSAAGAGTTEADELPFMNYAYPQAMEPPRSSAFRGPSAIRRDATWLLQGVCTIQRVQVELIAVELDNRRLAVRSSEPSTLEIGKSTAHFLIKIPAKRRMQLAEVQFIGQVTLLRLKAYPSILQVFKSFPLQNKAAAAATATEATQAGDDSLNPIDTLAMSKSDQLAQRMGTILGSAKKGMIMYRGTFTLRSLNCSLMHSKFNYLQAKGKNLTGCAESRSELVTSRECVQADAFTDGISEMVRQRLLYKCQQARQRTKASRYPAPPNTTAQLYLKGSASFFAEVLVVQYVADSMMDRTSHAAPPMMKSPLRRQGGSPLTNRSAPPLELDDDVSRAYTPLGATIQRQREGRYSIFGDVGSERGSFPSAAAAADEAKRHKKNSQVLVGTVGGIAVVAQQSEKHQDQGNLQTNVQVEVGRAALGVPFRPQALDTVQPQVQQLVMAWREAIESFLKQRHTASNEADVTSPGPAAEPPMAPRRYSSQQPSSTSFSTSEPPQRAAETSAGPARSSDPTPPQQAMRNVVLIVQAHCIELSAGLPQEITVLLQIPLISVVAQHSSLERRTAIKGHMHPFTLKSFDPDSEQHSASLPDMYFTFAQDDHKRLSTVLIDEVEVTVSPGLINHVVLAYEKIVNEMILVFSRPLTTKPATASPADGGSESPNRLPGALQWSTTGRAPLPRGGGALEGADFLQQVEGQPSPVRQHQRRSSVLALVKGVRVSYLTSMTNLRLSVLRFNALAETYCTALHASLKWTVNVMNVQVALVDRDDQDQLVATGAVARGLMGTTIGASTTQSVNHGSSRPNLSPPSTVAPPRGSPPHVSLASTMRGKSEETVSATSTMTATVHSSCASHMERPLGGYIWGSAEASLCLSSWRQGVLSNDSAHLEECGSPCFDDGRPGAASPLLHRSSIPRAEGWHSPLRSPQLTRPASLGSTAAFRHAGLVQPAPREPSASPSGGERGANGNPRNATPPGVGSRAANLYPMPQFDMSPALYEVAESWEDAAPTDTMKSQTKWNLAIDSPLIILRFGLVQLLTQSINETKDLITEMKAATQLESKLFRAELASSKAFRKLQRERLEMEAMMSRMQQSRAPRDNGDSDAPAIPRATGRAGPSPSGGPRNPLDSTITPGPPWSAQRRPALTGIGDEVRGAFDVVQEHKVVALVRHFLVVLPFGDAAFRSILEERPEVFACEKTHRHVHTSLCLDRQKLIPTMAAKLRMSEVSFICSLEDGKQFFPVVKPLEPEASAQPTPWRTRSTGIGTPYEHPVSIAAPVMSIAHEYTESKKFSGRFSITDTIIYAADGSPLDYCTPVERLLSTTRLLGGLGTLTSLSHEEHTRSRNKAIAHFIEVPFHVTKRHNDVSVRAILEVTEPRVSLSSRIVSILSSIAEEMSSLRLPNHLLGPKGKRAAREAMQASSTPVAPSSPQAAPPQTAFTGDANNARAPPPPPRQSQTTPLTPSPSALNCEALSEAVPCNPTSSTGSPLSRTLLAAARRRKLLNFLLGNKMASPLSARDAGAARTGSEDQGGASTRRAESVGTRSVRYVDPTPPVNGDGRRSSSAEPARGTPGSPSLPRAASRTIEVAHADDHGAQPSSAHTKTRLRYTLDVSARLEAGSVTFYSAATPNATQGSEGAPAPATISRLLRKVQSQQRRRVAFNVKESPHVSQGAAGDPAAGAEYHDGASTGLPSSPLSGGRSSSMHVLMRIPLPAVHLAGIAKVGGLPTDDEEIIFRMEVQANTMEITPAVATLTREIEEWATRHNKDSTERAERIYTFVQNLESTAKQVNVVMYSSLMEFALPLPRAFVAALSEAKILNALLRRRSTVEKNATTTTNNRSSRVANRVGSDSGRARARAHRMAAPPTLHGGTAGNRAAGKDRPTPLSLHDSHEPLRKVIFHSFRVCVKGIRFVLSSEPMSSTSLSVFLDDRNGSLDAMLTHIQHPKNDRRHRAVATYPITSVVVCVRNFRAECRAKLEVKSVELCVPQMELCVAKRKTLSGYVRSVVLSFQNEFPASGELELTVRAQHLSQLFTIGLLWHRTVMETLLSIRKLFSRGAPAQVLTKSVQTAPLVVRQREKLRAEALQEAGADQHVMLVCLVDQAVVRFDLGNGNLHHGSVKGLNVAMEHIHSGAGVETLVMEALVVSLMIRSEGVLSGVVSVEGVATKLFFIRNPTNTAAPTRSPNLRTFRFNICLSRFYVAFKERQLRDVVEVFVKDLVINTMDGVSLDGSVEVSLDVNVQKGTAGITPSSVSTFMNALRSVSDILASQKAVALVKLESFHLFQPTSTFKAQLQGVVADFEQMLSVEDGLLLSQATSMANFADGNAANWSTMYGPASPAPGLMGTVPVMEQRDAASAAVPDTAAPSPTAKTSSTAPVAPRLLEFMGNALSTIPCGEINICLQDTTVVLGAVSKTVMASSGSNCVVASFPRAKFGFAECSSDRGTVVKKVLTIEIVNAELYRPAMKRIVVMGFRGTNYFEFYTHQLIGSADVGFVLNLDQSHPWTGNPRFVDFEELVQIVRSFTEKSNREVFHNFGQLRSDVDGSDEAMASAKMRTTESTVGSDFSGGGVGGNGGGGGGGGGGSGGGGSGRSSLRYRRSPLSAAKAASGVPAIASPRPPGSHLGVLKGSSAPQASTGIGTSVYWRGNSNSAMGEATRGGEATEVESSLGSSAVSRAKPASGEQRVLRPLRFVKFSPQLRFVGDVSVNMDVIFNWLGITQKMLPRVLHNGVCDKLELLLHLMGTAARERLQYTPPGTAAAAPASSGPSTSTPPTTPGGVLPNRAAL